MSMSKPTTTIRPIRKMMPTTLPKNFQDASHTTLPHACSDRSDAPAPTAALPRGINSAFVLRFPDPAAGTRGPGILMPLAAC